MNSWRLLPVMTALLVVPLTASAQTAQTERTQRLERLGILLGATPAPQAPQTTAAAGSAGASASTERNVSRMVNGLRRAQIESAVLDPLGVSTQNSLDPQLTVTADK